MIVLLYQCWRLFVRQAREGQKDISALSLPLAPVSARADGTPFNSMLPPPVSARTGPLAELKRMLPPPVSISAAPPMSPSSILPPPVVALRWPLQRST